MPGWKCANDEAEHVKIDEPPQENRIAEGSKSFALGDCKAILAKGGPSDCFVFAHLHAIHGDRHGESHYTISVTIDGEDKYPYFISDPLTTTVEGVWDKPERHRHCFAAFNPPTDDLKLAIQNNKKLIVKVRGSRERDDWKWLTQEFKEILEDVSEEVVKGYLSGAISPVDMLRILQGNSPEIGRAHV